MILYHFTRTELVDRILKQGLVPKPDRNKMLGGEKVVWLTERRTLDISMRDTWSIFFRSGRHMLRWYFDGAGEGEVARLSVRIPDDHDCFEYGPWLRRNAQKVMPDRDNRRWVTAMSRGHWICLEKIPASWILRVKPVPGAEPKGEIEITFDGEPARMGFA